MNQPHSSTKPVLSSLPLEDHPGSHYHPDFTEIGLLGLGSAVTLVSRDGLRFRISSNALRASSRVFETTLSLPQPPETCTEEIAIDNLDEDAITIEGLLRIITGKKFPPLDTIEAIEPIAFAAEKWQMPGPLSILRTLLLVNPTFSTDHPIRLYWFGCRMGWDDVAQLASKFSCNFDLYYDQHSEFLKRLDSEELLRLVRFHRTRRDSMEIFLRAGSLAHTNCVDWRYKSPSPLADTVQFHDFQSRFLEFMDSSSPGKPLVAFESKIREMTQASGLETAVCSKPKGCPKQNHCRAALITPLITAQWAILPQTIGDPGQETIPSQDFMPTWDD